MYSFKDKDGNSPNISTKQQLLVWLCLYIPENCNWPKEIKIANKLLKKYPDIKFWRSLDLDRKPMTLSFFLTGKGKRFLKGKYFIYKRISKLDLNPKKEYNISKEKVGEDKKIKKKKPTTLMEFINYGKEK